MTAAIIIGVALGVIADAISLAYHRRWMRALLADVTRMAWRAETAARKCADLTSTPGKQG